MLRGYGTLLNAEENLPHVNLAAGCSVEPTPTSPLTSVPECILHVITPVLELPSQDIAET